MFEATKYALVGGGGDTQVASSGQDCEQTCIGLRLRTLECKSVAVHRNKRDV